MSTIRIKRIYSDPGGVEGDGYRIFVDRLWPRGESKDKFHYDLWAKDIAPSTELREWFHADESNRWDEFARRYMAELEASPVAEGLKADVERHPVVTLLYGARDTLHNNAVILQEFLSR